MPEEHRGRPVTVDPKTMRVDIRLAESEWKILDEYCQKMGVSRPQGLRDGIKALNAKKKGSGAVDKRMYTTSHLPPAARRAA